LETYLKTAFGFIGITPEFILAEGIALGPDHKQAALDKALAIAAELKAA
jgi:FMN-dependent NADH-azoreductase